MVEITAETRVGFPEEIVVRGKRVGAYNGGDKFGEWVQYNTQVKVGNETIDVEVYAEPRYVRATYHHANSDDVLYAYEGMCKLGDEGQRIAKAVGELHRVMRNIEKGVRER